MKEWSVLLRVRMAFKMTNKTVLLPIQIHRSSVELDLVRISVNTTGIALILIMTWTPCYSIEMNQIVTYIFNISTITSICHVWQLLSLKHLILFFLFFSVNRVGAQTAQEDFKWRSVVEIGWAVDLDRPASFASWQMDIMRSFSTLLFNIWIKSVVLKNRERPVERRLIRVIFISSSHAYVDYNPFAPGNTNWSF